MCTRTGHTYVHASQVKRIYAIPYLPRCGRTLFVYVAYIPIPCRTKACCAAAAADEKAPRTNADAVVASHGSLGQEREKASNDDYSYALCRISPAKSGEGVVGGKKVCTLFPTPPWPSPAPLLHCIPPHALLRQNLDLNSNRF